LPLMPQPSVPDPGRGLGQFRRQSVVMMI